MGKHKKLYDRMGMALLSLPSTKADRTNNKRRNVGNIDATSSAHVISVTGIRPEEPILFCGRYNKAIPMIRQLIKQSERPFVFVGTKRDLNENSCLCLFETQWEYETPLESLPEGNGKIVLESGAETNLALKNFISNWDSHFILMCLGNGLQIDQELLNLLNGVGHYMLISENLQRGIKCFDGVKMSASELLESMDYIIISSIGTAGKELLKVLPEFEYEKITNSMDFSYHHDAPHEHKGKHHRNGGGLSLNQSKTRESRCIFTEEDLREMQDSNKMLIYNTQYSRAWIAKVTA